MPLTEGESDEELCAGIVVGAARLRAAAFAASRLRGESPALTGPSWKRAATAAAIISDISDQMTALLAERSVALRQPPGAAESLHHAQSAFADASVSWLRSARIWGAISTDSQHASSPCAAEASGLALRLGRLLYCDPAWVPGRRQAAPRDLGRLAPGPTAWGRVLGAVHEAADALARMAKADAGGIRAVRQQDRLYIDSQFLTDDNALRRFQRAPGDRVHLLNNAYYLCGDASLRAATALYKLAMDIGTASRGLAFRRTGLSASEAIPAETGYELANAAFAARMEYFARPKNNPLRPRSEVDADAIIHAYEVEKLTTQDIADRFTMSLTSVRQLFEENGGTARQRRRTAAQLAAVDRPCNGPQVINPIVGPSGQQASSRQGQGAQPGHAQQLG
ncbi:MAG TPA: hypothetical protein VG142_03355 [Trebonia sp.]|nr:hypothetical protein [Trebonia sp.]